MDALAKRHHIELKAKRSLEAEIGEGEIGEGRVLLGKPETFMNASGRTVQKILSKYPVNAHDLIIVYDDADLPFGDIRHKPAGSSAGHRGMQSIIEALPSGTSIARVRVGIGRPEHPDMPLDEFVLQKWNASEQRMLQTVVNQAAEHVEQLIAPS